MKLTNNWWLTMIIAAVCVAMPSGWSQEKTSDDKSEVKEILDEFTGAFEVRGVGIAGKDRASQYMEFRDVRNGEISNLEVRKKANEDDDMFFRLKASNISQDDQRFDLSFGHYGLYEFTFQWDRTPHHYGMSGSTLYSGIGSDRLTLPVQMRTDLQGATGAAQVNMFRDYAYNGSNRLDDLNDIALLRDRFSFGLALLSLEPFRLSVNVDFENRTGNRPIWGNANTVSQILAPIEYQTWNMTFAATYAQDDLDFGFYYTFSLFENRNESLTWDNPLRATDAAFVGSNSDPAAGRMSLESDSLMHNMSFRGGYNFSADTRLSAEATVSLRDSNTDLLPYTINSRLRIGGTATTLPLASDPNNLPMRAFDGETITQYYQVALTTRLMDNLDAKIYTQYYDFDDRSDHATFPGAVWNDRSWIITPSTTFPTGIQNEHLDYHIWTSGLSFNWKLEDLATRIKPAYKYQQTRRENRDNVEVDESTLSLAIETDLTKTVQTEFGGKLARRNGDHYERAPRPVIPTNLQQLDISDRDRLEAHAGMKFTPSQNFNTNINYTYGIDGYNSTKFGMRDADMHTVMVDFTIAADADASFTGYFGYQFMNTKQKGRASGTIVTPDYIGDFKYDIEDTMFLLGFRSNWSLIPEKLFFDAGYSLALGRSNVSPERAISTTPNQPYLDPIANADNSTRHTIDLKLTYKWTPRANFFVGYQFEYFRSRNFYNDNMSSVVTTSTGAVGSYTLDLVTEDANVHIGYAGFGLEF